MEKFQLYHGTTEHHAIGILGENKLDDSIGEHHYLGTGIYLYNDEDQALVWARLKAPKFKSKPCIIVATVEIDPIDVYDLDGRIEQNDFFRERNYYLKLIKRREVEEEYYTDSRFCDFLANKLCVKMLTKTFAYIHPRETQLEYKFSNDKETDRDITRHFRTEKQFCLKDRTCIIKIEKL